MGKRWIVVALIVVVLAAISAVVYQGNRKPGGPVAGEQDHKLRIGLVLSVGGRGDNGFNDMAIAAVERAEKELGAEIKIIEPKQMASDEESLRYLAENNYDLTIGIGFMMKESLEKVAKEFPNSKFVMVDVPVDLPNVASIAFKEHEGSFLAGALAGMMTKSNKIGFVGALKMPLIERFEVGYKEGAQYVNPNVTVITNYAGTDPSAFNNPAAGKELALAQVQRGADVLFHAAGPTGLGVIEGAKETKTWMIGEDVNQNSVAPGIVLTSMMKKVDVAVYDTIKAYSEGNFKAGINIYGLAENGVGLADFEYTADKVPQEVKDKLAEIRQKIIDGDIKVTDPMEQ